jgi:hypothetical protein
MVMRQFLIKMTLNGVVRGQFTGLHHASLGHVVLVIKKPGTAKVLSG